MKVSVPFYLFVLVFLCLHIPGYAQNAADLIQPISAKKKKPIPNEKDLGDLAKGVFHHMGKPLIPEKGKEIYFSFLPLAITPPGGGNALITSTSAGFYMGARENTYLSTASFAPYWNFGSQFGLPLRANVWLNKNIGLLDADIRFLFYPQYTWGLGNGKAESQKLLINYKYLRTYFTAYKRIKPFLYLGLGFNMDYHIHISTSDSSLQTYSGYAYGTVEGSNSISMSPNLDFLYDHRYAFSDMLPISYIHFIYRQNLFKTQGASTNWSSVFLDVRKYFYLTNNPQEQNILALRTFLWNTMGNTTPYLDLPSIGWDPYDRSGRGIQQNRYRGKSLIYFEAEYRKDITRNGLLGFVSFVNINSALEPSSGKFETFHPGLGSGLRIKVSKVTKTNLAIDYAFSNDYSGIWLALGEAF